MKKLLFFVLFVFMAVSSRASTLILEGTAEDSVNITQERFFSVPSGGLKKLSFRFANPADFRNGPLTQSISGRRVNFEPRPDSVTTERDAFGNSFTVVTWMNLNRDAFVKEEFNARLKIDLNGIKSRAPFPIGHIPDGEKIFLRPTKETQSDNAEIRSLARKLTEGANTEQLAVMALLNWVVDNIKYKTPVPEYGAVWTLRGGQGNCQNYSHLSIALLRSVGIPARIVGGVALGKPWKVPLKDGGALMQSIGQGGHAWMEVWYPDLGWVPYDPQQSHLFVGSRHVKQTVGLDAGDINDSWRASPVLPPFRENISADFIIDKTDLMLKNTIQAPVNYIMAASAAPVAPVKPAIEEKPVELTGEAEFGNLEFPSLVDFFVKSGDETGTKTFDKETAEYVSGDTVYAQAFTVGGPFALASISLAMHKFGGRLGSLWIDIVNDEGGKPGMDGFRSLPLSLDTIAYYAGYKWFDFRFPEGGDRPVLKPGKYWIILRHSKDAIVNWFYIPGNRYGGPDDARSTAAGINWSNVMNYDFNFKVKGVFLKKDR